MIDLIKEDLEKNRDHYLFITNALRLSKETFLKQEDDLFYEDIMEDYKMALKQLLTEDIVNRLNASPEDAMIVIESFDIVKYIEGE